MTLGEFLKREVGARAPWNCSTMPADWCVALGHPDFAADWRTTTDPVECDSAPVMAGGLVNLWDRGIGDALPAVVVPFQTGDIAVIEIIGEHTGAIYTGERWALRGERRVHFFCPDDIAVVKVWRP